jgi:predicted aminopeptidase
MSKNDIHAVFQIARRQCGFRLAPSIRRLKSCLIDAGTAVGRHTIPYRITGVILALGALYGCSTLEYYAQTAAGHIDLMTRARPIEALLGRPDTPQSLRDRLSLVLELRRYASEQLGLPDNGSYTRYAALDRPFVVWNVFAAPELSVAPRQWCFPVVGCVAYRGYFREEDAMRFAGGLRAGGLDAAVAGVPAYSTLGWFDDPLPSTVIAYPVERLAGLIFHELSHQVVYIPNDATFNESFATVVELEGARRWFAARGESEAAARQRRMKERDSRVARLVLDYRERLEAVYRADAPEEWKRARKRMLFAALRREYLALSAADPALAGYEEWFDGEANNARLVPFATYYRHVAAFESLLSRCSGDLEAFYAAVRDIGAMAAEDRHARLAALAAASASAADPCARPQPSRER